MEGDVVKAGEGNGDGYVSEKLCRERCRTRHHKKWLSACKHAGIPVIAAMNKTSALFLPVQRDG